MAMEANLLGSGFTFNIVDFSLGDLAAKVAEYMESRDKLKREARENTIDDLRCAMSIVMGLTNRYIDLMQAFSTPEVVSDHQSLGETIEEADDYLKRRDLLPYLVSVRRVLESYESSVIQEWWPDSRRGHRCGRARTAPVTTAASCDIRAI